jgi:hypothetical protein
MKIPFFNALLPLVAVARHAVDPAPQGKAPGQP